MRRAQDRARSARSRKNGARSAPIESRTLGALKLASCARWECAGCDAFLNKRKGKKDNKNATEANDFSLCLKRIIVVDDILCYSCRLSIYKKGLKNISNSDKKDASPSDNESINNDSTFEIKLKSNDEIPDVERIELPIQRTVASHKYVCLCLSKINLTIIPKEARTQSYINERI